MKVIKLKYIIVLCLISVFSIDNATAQMGVGTTTPEGALDLETSSMGLVLPRVSLLTTTDVTTVVNPTGNPLKAGTTVYNTNLSITGANDVYPGIYAWNGTSWKPQFVMEEYVNYKQTGGCLRTDTENSLSTGLADNIPGLTNRTFTPTYSGNYRIVVKTNYGAGKILDFTNVSNMALATSEGSFFFSMSGTGVSINPASSSYDYTQGWMYTHAYSSHNQIESPTIENFNVPHFAEVTHIKYLIAGATYNFNLSHVTATGGSYFVGNGDTGDGMGHVGHSIPCNVEFTYIGE